MVAMCCICKSHLGQQKDVSYHKIPKKENLANEWIKIISEFGINVTKTTTVCSKHFDETQLQYKIVGGTIQRFLTSNAIPTLNVTDPPCPRQHPSNCDQDTMREEEDDMEDAVVEESGFHGNLVNVETEDKNLTSCKRKENSADETNTKRARVKTIRYIGDIGREDFISDEAYKIVKNYINYSKNEIKILKQKVRRMDSKIKTMKDLTDNLKEYINESNSRTFTKLNESGVA